MSDPTPGGETGTEVDFVLRRLDNWVRKGRGAHEAAAPGPIRELHLELTHRCNLKCAMCHHWRTAEKDPSGSSAELTVEEIRAAVEPSRLLDGIETVTLTGGEPWLRKDLVDIAAMLARRFPRARLGVLTNFSSPDLIRDRLKELDERGVRRLWLGSSLDGLEETHDRIRGRKGSFRSALRSAELLREEFPQVDAGFSFTITPLNYADLWPCYELVRDRRLAFGAQLVVNHKGVDAPEPFEWTPEQTEAVKRDIGRILVDIARREQALELMMRGPAAELTGLWARLLFWRLLRDYADAPRRFFKNCLAGSRHAMIGPEGGVFFCPVNKHRTVGSVREASFDDIWRSKRADSEREYAASGKCDCWLTCVALPVLGSVLSNAVR